MALKLPTATIKKKKKNTSLPPLWEARFYWTLLWKIFSSFSPKEGKEVRLGRIFAPPPPFIRLLIILHIWQCLCASDALVECASVFGTKAKRHHLTASPWMHGMDRRAGILHKEIKMCVSCCDTGVFEEKEERRIYCIVLTRVSTETSGPVVSQKSAEGRESSEVHS